MSERNVELTRRLLEAFNARDRDAYIALSDPGVEFHTPFAAVGAVYRGHDAVEMWQRDIDDAWGDELRVEPQAYFDLGEHTLVFQVLHGRGRRSGVEVAMPTALVARWRDGLLLHGKGYAHRQDALKDLGVSEDELDPIDP
jgi:ketosteroid isomerase-like protein